MWHFFKNVIFKLIIEKSALGTHCEIALRWMSEDLTNDKLTLVQVMVWCCGAPSHYPSECWHRSMSPYGVIKPQWFKVLAIPCPKALANLVVEVGTRHSHQILLETILLKLHCVPPGPLSKIWINFNQGDVRHLKNYFRQDHNQVAKFNVMMLCCTCQ